MGCGCGRSGSARRERLKSQRSKILKEQIKKPSLKSKRITKYDVCNSCPESKTSYIGKRRSVQRCRKCSRLVKNIIKDPSFSCTLGKWENVT